MLWWALAAWGGEGSGFVLVDREAREFGVEVLVDDEDLDGTLPVEVERDVEILIVVDEVERAAWIEPGMLYLVQGRKGRVRVVKPGVNADPDAVRLITDVETARSVADVTGVTWRADGDGFLLEGAGILEELSRVALPTEDLDVEIVPLGPAHRATRVPTRRVHEDDEAPGGTPSGGAVVAAPTARKVFRLRRRAGPALVAVAAPDDAVALPAGERPPELVGWYCREDSCLVLGVDGLARRCVGDACLPDGAWSAIDGGVLVDATPWLWVDGMLVRQ